MKRRGVKCGCGGDCEKCAPTQAPDLAARHVGTGRFLTVAPAEAPGQFGRAFHRNYEVQPYTGWAVSTVPAGQWGRGVFMYAPSPALHLTAQAPMYDRTDPRTWPTRLTG